MRIVLTNGANLYLMLNMMYWKMQYDMEERALSEGESITYKILGTQGKYFDGL